MICTLPAHDDAYGDALGKVAGFSQHAGVAAKAHQRDKLECLCRYIARPAVSEKRLSLTAHGKVQYQLKTPYRDGTTHVFFEPLDFIARLVALVPKPRVNLTRFHGVFAPNSHLRAQVVPGRRNGNKAKAPDAQDPAPAERRASMTWAQRRCSARRKHQGFGRPKSRQRMSRDISGVGRTGLLNRAPFAVRVG